jgi:hypothetical protein
MLTSVQGVSVLSWPVWATNWVLEQTAGPQVFPWSRISPGSYSNDGTYWHLTISPAPLAASRFYRLRHVRPAPPGATGYWSLDEGTGLTAEDGTDLKATMFLHDATWGIGRTGPGAVRFNGEPNDEGGSLAWVNNINYGVLPASGRPFSVSFWFNPDGLKTGWQGLAGNDANARDGWNLALYTPGAGTNYLVFAGMGPSSSLIVTGRTLLLPGQWHELTVTHDGSEGRIYLDASLLGRALGPVTTHEGAIYFGGRVGNYDSFLGRMDDIRVYTNALTHEEISLTGHWRFDENTGAFAKDSSLNVNHATLTHQTGRIPGRQGSAIPLDDNQIIIPNDDYTVLPGSGGEFSLSFWFRPDVLLAGRTALMSCGGDINGWQLGLSITPPGEARVWMESTNNGGTLALAAPIPVTNGVWTKIDVTYNGGIATAYANGRKLRSESGAIRGTSAPLIVGAAPGVMNFSGVIDELKVYRRERNETEIGPVARTMWETALMNTATNIALQGFGPPGRPLTYAIAPILVQTNGSVSVAGSTATYQARGRKGPDAFAYTVSDGEFTSAPAIVALSVVQPHWLSPAGGTGPLLDGSTPERAWLAGPAAALDAIWKTNNYYDCFFYAPGEYETTGWKSIERPTVYAGCKHVGSGSAGPNPTVVKLVNVWDALAEGVIFCLPDGVSFCNGFEVHHMVLDCSAENNPQYAQGEPVWIRIPLTTTSWVDSVKLRWKERETPTSLGTNRLGRGTQFDICSRVRSGQGYITNCTSATGAGLVDVLTVATNTDELVIRLNRRAAGVDFYSLAEIEVSGAQVSLPAATTQGGGPSRLSGFDSILSAVDENSATYWVSGSEPQVEIALPLAPDTAVSQMNLEWKCTTIDGIGRLGVASDYIVRARDQNTGEYFDVPIVRHARTGRGSETVTFGTIVSTNAVVTDRLLILLNARVPQTDYYGLSEIALQNGSKSVKMRLPGARSTLAWGITYGVLRAFDGNEGTEWVCGTQGMIGALGVSGSNLKFTNLKIMGFGTKAGRECFPMMIVSNGRHREPQAFGNILVEDCLLAEPATNNTGGVTALNIASNPPDTLTNAVIRRCTVTNLRPYFPVSQAFGAAHVENCLVRDCNTAVYFEPDSSGIDDMGPVLIRSNVFVNVDRGLYVLSHPGAQFDSLTYLNNEIILAGSNGWGFLGCDTCDPGMSGSMTNVTALNNVVRYADWMPRVNSQDGGFFYSDIHHAVFANNVIALGTPNSLRVRAYPAGVILPPPPTEDCDGNVFTPPQGITYPPPVDPLRPGYRRAWFNNRNISGTLLDVRISRFGSDGLASQQQWPE